MRHRKYATTFIVSIAMTELSLVRAIETRSGLISDDYATVQVAESEKRAHSLIELASTSIQRRDAVLLEAAFVGFAGVPLDFRSQHYVIWNDDLRRDLSRARADVMAAFIETDPRRAADCLTRYAGHESGTFFQGDCQSDCDAATGAVRALCRLGDTPEDLAFIRTTFPQALRHVASALMEGGSRTLELARDAAALLEKLRSDPATGADVDAAARAIVSGLRERRGRAEHIAIYEGVLPASGSGSPKRPVSNRARSKPASHEK